MARKVDAFDPLLLHGAEDWVPTKKRPEVGVWTDDVSNVWGVVLWEH